ncbi:MAG: hypothetical protein KDA28_01950 [Phycisphaerales bacterium]|nr:hypothetical protein [Phycisphaerales bacterium]
MRRLSRRTSIALVSFVILLIAGVIIFGPIRRGSSGVTLDEPSDGGQEPEPHDDVRDDPPDSSASTRREDLGERLARARAGVRAPRPADWPFAVEDTRSLASIG